MKLRISSVLLLMVSYSKRFAHKLEMIKISKSFNVLLILMTLLSVTRKNVVFAIQDSSDT